MKTILTILCLLFASTMATPVTAKTENCKQAGDYAQAIMKYRQEQRSLSKIMKNYEDLYEIGQLTKEGLAWAKGLILHAYDDYKAKYSHEGRMKITNDFRNKVMLECFKGANK